ncbi:dipeptidyl peptidase 1-like [Gigantopelta aegis]|uniref:dipeptidyl peptidase 1-like n=1 Tax=Gigantopelta aegis TaxID=1735272 RepID=UPI001B889F4C|nr:dipeptidyl peptidase 1-like [Gigantopelta aegis]
MSPSLLVTLTLCLAFVPPSVRADTFANCSYEQIVGTWTFLMGPDNNDNTINCSIPFQEVTTYTLTLYFPDIAVDTAGNQGFWTLIYNQGFEVVINNKKFFAFSFYAENPKPYVSVCNETFPGWSHNIDGHNWACYSARKISKSPNSPLVFKETNRHTWKYGRKYIPNVEFINDINKEQKLWRADLYWEYRHWSNADLLQRAGGFRSGRAFPKTAPVTSSQEKVAASLPKEFDWRDVNGVSFVSPVRDQGSCGSCYAFGSMAMYEARQRIVTNNTVQLVFSTQDVVSCSQYSQGCEGGFPYLVAGKYGQDFGLIEDSCFPYSARDEPCKMSQCRRYYTRDYYYVGGFYGACNEALMRIELVKNGPIAVSFEVYPDFPSYKGGIYIHTKLADRFNPWEITNHVVLIVGYGRDLKSGVPFWIVKNSWGNKWGEDGYFRIRRGTDECSMESMAVGITPIL